MKPARIEGHTLALAPPVDWDAEANGHCGTLYARAEVLDGVSFMRSAWDVEVLEALMLAAGGKLVLGISGYQHPVVNLSHSIPPEEFEPLLLCRRVLVPGSPPQVRVDALYPHGASGIHVHAVVDIADMTFEIAAMKAIEAAETHAHDIQSGKKELP